MNDGYPTISVVPREHCDAQIRIQGLRYAFKRCSRKAVEPVPTDRGDFGLCSQHFQKFRRDGVWVKAGMEEFIQPAHVLLVAREKVLG